MTDAVGNALPGIEEEGQPREARYAYLGIDPGLTGSMALLQEQSVTVWDLHGICIGKRKELDIEGFCRDVRTALDMERGWLSVALEEVHAMPRQGSASTFGFGATYGAIKAVLTVLHVRFVTVTPQQWQKVVRVTADKDAHRALAARLYPSAAPQLTRKKDADRADAILIAEWLKRQEGGNA